MINAATQGGVGLNGYVERPGIATYLQLGYAVQRLNEEAVVTHLLQRGLAHPGHGAHGDHDVLRVGDLHPELGSSAPSGPMQNGTTYMVRPRIQPRYSDVMTVRISKGSIQLLVAHQRHQRPRRHPRHRLGLHRPCPRTANFYPGRRRGLNKPDHHPRIRINTIDFHDFVVGGDTTSLVADVGGTVGGITVPVFHMSAGNRPPGRGTTPRRGASRVTTKDHSLATGWVWTGGGGQVGGSTLHSFEVVGSRQLAPHMVRVLLGGNGFETFVPSDFTDSYVKLVLTAAAIRAPRGAVAPTDLSKFQSARRRHHCGVIVDLRNAGTKSSAGRYRFCGPRLRRRWA